MKIKILLLVTTLTISNNAATREVEAKIYCGNSDGTQWGWLHTDEYNPSNDNVVTVRGEFKFFQTMVYNNWEDPHYIHKGALILSDSSDYYKYVSDCQSYGFHNDVNGDSWYNWNVHAEVPGYSRHWMGIATSDPDIRLSPGYYSSFVGNPEPTNH
ncbi:TPA: hypothetical protein P0E04_004590 [Vibrio campbellii]|uniref:Pullulanase n=1 Tax=Vibrio campbellii TaxID=680 RepID=A0ABY5IHT0_9VIBR|nr:hypothetical protein [Vibrio campbellii]UTZ24667.1 hypothetical protein HB760_23490 [Vibrio campbellii]UTZ33197.1 hypothetical protein HB762_17960 [Vibrio campbellii]HDM8046305.1 hypothetical protein [Vibrio campbellii]